VEDGLLSALSGGSFGFGFFGFGFGFSFGFGFGFGFVFRFLAGIYKVPPSSVFSSICATGTPLIKIASSWCSCEVIPPILGSDLALRRRRGCLSHRCPYSR
jgi:hypothetical protein